MKDDPQTWKGDIYRRKQRAIVAAQQAMEEARNRDMDLNIHTLLSEMQRLYAIPRKGLKEAVEEYLEIRHATLDDEGHIIWPTIKKVAIDQPSKIDLDKIKSKKNE